jgi:hypothetical protein
MGWEDFFPYDLAEHLDFSLTAQNLVLPVFDSTSGALNDGWKKSEQDYKTQIGEAYKIDESEGQILSQERAWAEGLHRQRLQGVGALALDWLMSSLQTALRGVKSHLDKAHPARPPYDDRDEGWLGLIRDEYQKRFGIDFTTGPVPFERIQELVLARNAGIHREQKGNVDTYVKKIKKPAFVDYGDDGEFFFVTRDALVAIIADSDKFITWVVGEIETRRKPQAV